MLTIREARVEDVPLLQTMIHEFAEFNHERHLIRTTEADLTRDGFGDSPRFHALLAHWHDQAAGYALFFDIYSTWEGRAGLFLEDVFVRSEFRGRGIGKGLLAVVAEVARRNGYYGVRWEVRSWNQSAIGLYKSLGGEFLDDHRSVLLSGEAFEKLATRAGK